MPHPPVLETYFLRSSAPTHPIEPKPSPVRRGDPNAVLVAEFRDSYPGAREIFDLWWPDDPKHLRDNAKCIK
jgi:hypothetical protein